MKIKILSLIIAAGVVFITGCATEAPVSRGITIQDYSKAANNAVSNILASGALDKASTHPAVFFVSRIINNTGQQLDTDLLTQKISNALFDSGKVKISSRDPKTKGDTEEANFLKDQNDQLPDFTLSGNIIEHIDRAGDTRLTTYSFQLSLNDAKTGDQVWQGETEIGKVSTRSSVSAF
jgi:PBP1b-binding outer membrane lipoprotein LpoB